MFGLFFVLYFVKLSVGIMAFRLNVLHRMSHGSSPMIPFCFFLFVIFLSGLGYNLIESTFLEESTFTNKGQRDQTVLKIRMLQCVIQNFF